jgi:hypothetical protein
MLKPFITPIILFMSIQHSFSTTENCQTIQACELVIKNAQLKISELSKLEIRYSQSGAKFVRDTSVPALGVAYRDPSGLIWGSALKRDGKFLTFSRYTDAITYCERGGVRLPDIKELEKLSGYLGTGSANGFSNKAIDGLEMIPGLNGYSDQLGFYFMSATRGDYGEIYLNGRNGNTLRRGAYTIDIDALAICVKESRISE